MLRFSVIVNLNPGAFFFHECITVRGALFRWFGIPHLLESDQRRV
jgi:hypothetical protein